MPNLDQFFTRVYRCPPLPILCPFAMALSFMLRPAQSACLVSQVHTATVPQARLMQSPWEGRCCARLRVNARLLHEYKRRNVRDTTDSDQRLSLVGYSYYEQKGFWVAVAARVTNLLALGFTAAFSGFLLLWVDWGALNADCLRQDACDILDVRRRPPTLLTRNGQRLADSDSVCALHNVHVLLVHIHDDA